MTKHKLDHEAAALARALCDAGYMPLPEYLRFCKDHGFNTADDSGGGGTTNPPPPGPPADDGPIG